MLKVQTREEPKYLTKLSQIPELKETERTSDPTV
jgi:hypothetical protein